MQKFSDRSPDFAPKDKTSGVPALWMNEAPEWFKDNLDKLPAPPPKRT